MLKKIVGHFFDQSSVFERLICYYNSLTFVISFFCLKLCKKILFTIITIFIVCNAKLMREIRE